MLFETIIRYCRNNDNYYKINLLLYALVLYALDKYANNNYIYTKKCAN